MYIIRILIAVILFFSFSSSDQLLSSEIKDNKAQEEPVVEANYLISPSDEVEIKIPGEDDLSSMYKVDNEGDILFPMIGRVKADESTTAQLADNIAYLLQKDYFKIKPAVSVQIKKFHKRKVIIYGEVNKPGPYELEEARNISLTELIALAGGPTDKACLNSAAVISPEKSGKSRVVKVRAGDVLDAREKDIILNPGDRVKIPSASVIVMGEVAKAGKYNFGDTSKMTLLGVISMAGGFTRIADINGVKVIRVDEFGNKKTMRVRVGNIYNGKEKDALLEPDDIVVVPESWF